MGKKTVAVPPAKTTQADLPEDQWRRLSDIRTQARNIKLGALDRKDYNRYVEALPDVAEKAGISSVPQPAFGTLDKLPVRPEEEEGREVID